jgi:RNA polymerase sigma factor (sigma-70 family)
MDETSDGDLLSQWAAGSRPAGDILIERYFGLLHRFFRTKTATESADLVQQTFLACIEARGRYRGVASFKAFLLGIARNQLFSHYARRKKQALDDTMTSVHDLRTSPSGMVARREHQQLLQEALMRIPLEAQTILELVYWEGLRGAELASVLDVPPNTASSKLRRARLLLEARLMELCENDSEVRELLGSMQRSGGGPASTPAWFASVPAALDGAGSGEG